MKSVLKIQFVSRLFCIFSGCLIPIAVSYAISGNWLSVIILAIVFVFGLFKAIDLDGSIYDSTKALAAVFSTYIKSISSSGSSAELIRKLFLSEVSDSNYKDIINEAFDSPDINQTIRE